MRTIVTSLALFVVVGLLSGCGGGGGSKISSKADYIAAADKVCADRDKRSVALAKSTDNGNVADVTRRLADIYSDTIARLKAIDLPPGAARAGAAAYVKSVLAMERPITRMRASAGAVEAAVKSKRTARVTAAVNELQTNVNTVQLIGDKADQDARAYGFKTCGQQRPPSPVS